jgi:hypothetical protein
VNRKRGRVNGNVVELREPGGLLDGALVEAEIRTLSETEDGHDLGMSRLDEDWDNPEDAVYDDWNRLFGVTKVGVVPYRDRFAE